MLPYSLFSVEIDAERFLSHGLPQFPDFIFLAGATRGNFLRRTHSHPFVGLKLNPVRQVMPEIFNPAT
jgi:hypothetical protein